MEIQSAQITVNGKILNGVLIYDKQKRKYIIQFDSHIIKNLQEHDLVYISIETYKNERI